MALSTFGQQEKMAKLMQGLLVFIYTTEIHHKYNPLAPKLHAQCTQQKTGM